MTSPEKHKKYQPAFDFIPAEGETAEIAPGVHWLRMPLSFELSHINLWLLEGPDSSAIVDAGFNTPQSVAIWEHILEQKESAIDKIFITHFHPDHFGLCGFLHDKTNAPVFMTEGEQSVIHHLTESGSDDNLQALYTPYYIAAGVPDTLMMQMLDKRKLFKKIISSLPPVSTVALGGDIALGGKTWRIIGGGGHTPEHACLYNTEDGIFIAGDIVLPDITPNISFFPGNAEGHDPLQDYYDTLKNIRQNIPDDVLILPSHGVPFRQLHKRIDAIITHHEQRCARIREICQTPKTAHEVMQALFAHRNLSVSDLFFALSETLAHLVHDVYQDRIVKSVENGVDFYKALN